MPDFTDPFETWLLHRVAEAVEAGEVSAGLLTELHAAIAAAHACPPEARHALALRDLAERLGLPMERLTAMRAALDAQSAARRARGEARHLWGEVPRAQES